MSTPVSAQPTEGSQLRARQLHRALTVLTAALLVVGLVRAWRLRWICDDAYISFRYADNLVEGHGLVWNVGERVEGFTNLLWTLALAGASALRLDLVWTSQALGVLSFAVVALASWRLAARWTSTPVVVPVAVWVWLLMDDALVWATGGLETMTVAAFATVMALLLFGSEAPSPRRELAAGVVGGLLVLTRADGALLAGMLALEYVHVRWSGWRLAVAGAARSLGPVLAAVAGNLAFRLAYYGEWLPNTYYAKSAGQAWWDQGLVYVGLLFGRNHVLIWMVLVALGMEIVERRAAKAGRPFVVQAADRAAGALTVTALVFVLYVAHSGGDFMFARRLIPVLPLVLVAFGRLLERLSSRRWQLAVSAALALAAALPYPLFERWAKGMRVRGVADERRVYTPAYVEQRRAQGVALGEALRGIDTYLLIEGGLCMLAYHSHLPHVMEMNGLTDPRIAKQPVGRRGIPGHEKRPTQELLDEIKATFLVLHSRPARLHDGDLVAVGDGKLYLAIVYWDDAIMAALDGRPGVAFASPDVQYARFTRRIGRAPCAMAKELFERFDRYYLRWHGEQQDWRQRLAELRDARCADQAAPP